MQSQKQRYIPTVKHLQQTWDDLQVLIDERGEKSRKWVLNI